MRILVDENIPLATQAFSVLGDVLLLPADAITPMAVRDADILLVRSVTKVNQRLLEESRVRFVGTATIGTDHIDEAYLRRRGIPFASAPGSNANSVAEYVATALLLLARCRGFDLAEKSIGIVGVGNVGSRAALKARALGMRVLLNDPPLKRMTDDPELLPLGALADRALPALGLHHLLLVLLGQAVAAGQVPPSALFGGPSLPCPRLPVRLVVGPLTHLAPCL